MKEKLGRLRGSLACKVLPFLLAVVFAAGAGAGTIGMVRLEDNASRDTYLWQLESAFSVDYARLREYLFLQLHADSLTAQGQESYEELARELTEDAGNLLYRVTDADGAEVFVNCTEEELTGAREHFLSMTDGGGSASAASHDETIVEMQFGLATWESSRYGLGVNRMLTHWLDMNGVDDWEVRAGSPSDWASTALTGDYYYELESLYDGLTAAERQSLDRYLAAQGIQTGETWPMTGEEIYDAEADSGSGAVDEGYTDVEETASSWAEEADQYCYFVYTGPDTWYTFSLGIRPELEAADSYELAVSSYYKAVAQYADYFQLISTGTAACVLLLLAMMAVLAWTSGWSREGKVVLNGLTRAPIEPAAALLVLLAMAGLLVVSRWAQPERLLDYCLIGAAACGGLALCALTGWYLLTAQVKGRMLWQLSISGRLVRMARGGLRRMREAAHRAAEQLPLFRKVLFALLGYAAVQMCWSAFLWGDLFYYSLPNGLFALMLAWALHSLPLVLPGVLLCRWALDWRRIRDGAERIAGGELDYTIDTAHMLPDLRRHGEQLGSISQGMSRAVEERVKSQRFKTELITNVSHDLKTPLTSIINYVGLLKQEDIQDEKIRGYIDVLDRKSQRLKTLTEDLVEASKAASGTIAVHLERLDLAQLLGQAVGEYEEKLAAAALIPVVHQPDHPCYAMADGRHLWRILDNLLGNCTKYAMPGTRVYLDLERRDGSYCITVKNISADPLNVPAEELLKRFVRGDSARTSEGSGLGLSIARNLAAAQGAGFDLVVDGDLFKAVVTFPAAPEPPAPPEETPGAPRPHPSAPKSAPTAPPAGEDSAAPAEAAEGEEKPPTPDNLETLLEGLDG